MGELDIVMGEGGDVFPSQDAVDAFTHITRSCYPADQYSRLGASEKQNIWHNKDK